MKEEKRRKKIIHTELNEKVLNTSIVTVFFFFAASPFAIEFVKRRNYFCCFEENEIECSPKKN